MNTRMKNLKKPKRCQSPRKIAKREILSGTNLVTASIVNPLKPLDHTIVRGVKGMFKLFEHMKNHNKFQLYSENGPPLSLDQQLRRKQQP